MNTIWNLNWILRQHRIEIKLFFEPPTLLLPVLKWIAIIHAFAIPNKLNFKINNLFSKKEHHSWDINNFSLNYYFFIFLLISQHGKLRGNFCKKGFQVMMQKKVPSEYLIDFTFLNSSAFFIKISILWTCFLNFL